MTQPPLAASPVGFVAYDAHGDIVSATGPPVEDRLTRSGLDERRVLGTRLAGLWPDSEAAVSRATIESLLGDAPAIEIDDEGRALALLFRPTLDEARRPSGGVCTVIDVTSLRAHRLLGTSAEDVLVRFTSGFSRLIEEIAGSASELAALGPGEPGDTSAQAADVASRLSALSRDLNVYSGRTAGRPVAISVNRWIVDFAGGVIRDLPEGVSLVLEACGGDVRISADEADLDYALTALVERAKSALGGRGLLTLSVEIPPDDRRDPAAPFGHGRVSVIDTGAPIPAESRDSLLLPFDPSGGRDLRLAAVRRVIERAGGSLRVSSGPSATFVEIDFPLLVERPTSGQ